jgi:rSAM/selenodomain-associated transferase 1
MFKRLGFNHKDAVKNCGRPSFMKRADAENTIGLCALAVMTKAPRAGEVKTRLSPPLTLEEAAALNICFLRDTTASISAAAANNVARGVVVYTPADSGAAYADILPAEFMLVSQRGEGLSERLIFAVEDLFRSGFASVCLIGSDSPTVPRSALVEATTLLAQPGDEIVLGQCEDGGYYLIGMKKLRRELFAEIAWSSERVGQQTVDQARRMNVKVNFLTTWYDVDELTSLCRLCDELFGLGQNAEGSPAPATRGFLKDLLAREGRDRIWPDQARQ